jgi:hypothetical protein
MKQFVVAVTGCSNCPHKSIYENGENHCANEKIEDDPVDKAQLYDQNKDSITETCPQYSKVHEQFKVGDVVDFNKRGIELFGTVEQPANKRLTVNKGPFKIAGIIYTLDNQHLYFQDEGEKTVHPIIANGVTETMHLAYVDPLRDWYTSSYFKKVEAPK